MVVYVAVCVVPGCWTNRGLFARQKTLMLGGSARNP